MQRPTRRYLAPLLLLAVAAVAVWTEWRQPEPPPAPQGPRRGSQIVYVDVGGWYQTTPHERAVLGAYDLRAVALPAGLPYELDSWRGLDLETEPEVMVYYGQPDLLMQRRYVNGEGQIIWVTAIASRGPKSYRSFEHTPHICYPSSGWATLADDILKIPLAEGAIAVRRGLFERQGTRFLVYYWYQWDSPTRDAAEGITSWRLTTDATQDVASAAERLAAFMRLLFVEVVLWHRF